MKINLLNEYMESTKGFEGKLHNNYYTYRTYR